MVDGFVVFDCFIHTLKKKSLLMEDKENYSRRSGLVAVE